MPPATIKVGSRKSPLALAQVQEIFGALNPCPPFEVMALDTVGDLDRSISLTCSPAENFFTDTLDRAVLNKTVDVAIHSAKDLPRDIPDGLAIFAITAVLDDSDSWVGRLPWANLPFGARVGTSSVLRQRQTKELHPNARIVDIRGTIQERLELVNRGAVDGIIVATCALKRLGLADLITDILPWEGMPLQGQLAVVGRGDDMVLKRLFAPLDVRIAYGKVVLVGAGPGDPGLITLRGMEALRRADCVFYDFLVDKDLLRHAPKAAHVYAGKRKQEHRLTQVELCRMLKGKAMQGLNVVRLKGGDPLIFGRGADEIAYLRSYHIEVEVVPGVSSATGIPSSLGVPLTARGIASTVAFISAHREDEDIHGPQPLLIPKCDTLVILMGLTKIYAIIATLKAQGWPALTPVLIVANGTKENQQILSGTLENIEDMVKEGKVAPPALIIVGNVAGFYHQRGKKTYLHCGTHPMVYQQLGKIIPWPMIALEPVIMTKEQQEQFAAQFDASSLVILTSPNAVAHFLALILGSRSLARVNAKIFAVIGKHTADALWAEEVHAHIISAQETAEGLLATLLAVMDPAGKEIFFPRSSLPNPFLINALTQRGARVHEWAVYTNVKLRRGSLPQEHLDGIIFTSPSTVNNFLEEYGTIPGQLDILAKGSVTHKALREAGYRSKIII